MVQVYVTDRQPYAREHTVSYKWFLVHAKMSEYS